MTKIKSFLRKLIPSKRRLIQLYAALLFNANIKGFFNGRIYQGPLKNICTPGLNCYSCPGASGACPLGSLQNALYSSGKKTPYYVIGIILLYSIMLGRFICGYLCPFGLIQELFYKIKTPKLKKSRITKALSYFKYVLLVFLVVIVPILYGIRNMPLPGFCKYICPAGTLEGALGLLSNKVNEGELAMLGPLFTWKFILMVSIIVGSVFIFRFFCRFICPLGALYGLFNRFAILGIKLEKPKCIDCGLCISKCKMDISKVGDHECINCGECVGVCPTKAISWRGSSFFIAPNEIPEKSAEEAVNDAPSIEAKYRRRRIITKTVSAVLLTSLLITSLVYYNFIDKPSCIYHVDDDLDYLCDECGADVTFGNRVGELCYGYDIKLHDFRGLTGEVFNPARNQGKITVINFWGTWCSGCVHELPYFDAVATEYSGAVTVLAIHTDLDFDTAGDYVKEHYPDSKIVFGKDDPAAGGDAYYTMLGGKGAYPITLILDDKGEIAFKYMHELTYEELKGSIDQLINK